MYYYYYTANPGHKANLVAHLESTCNYSSRLIALVCSSGHRGSPPKAGRPKHPAQTVVNRIVLALGKLC